MSLEQCLMCKAETPWWYYCSNRLRTNKIMIIAIIKTVIVENQVFVLSILEFSSVKTCQQLVLHSFTNIHVQQVQKIRYFTQFTKAFFKLDMGTNWNNTVAGNLSNWVFSIV